MLLINNLALVRLCGLDLVVDFHDKAGASLYWGNINKNKCIQCWVLLLSKANDYNSDLQELIVFQVTSE